MLNAPPNLLAGGAVVAARVVRAFDVKFVGACRGGKKTK
jgi:hypothetical protein